jgi:hypothetical protein
MRLRARIAVHVVMSCVVSAPVVVAAQTAGSRWEVDVHGGGGFDRTPTSGHASLPPAGQTFQTVVGTTTRRASSWYLGDGALLLNQINGVFASAGAPSTSRLTPLDPVLQSASGTRASGGTVGFRVAYALTSRFGAEFTLDAAQGKTTFTGEALDGIEATRSSFITALNERNGLLSTGLGIVFINPTITSTADVNDNRGRQLFTTGALTINLARQGRIVPYVAVGGGVVSNVGDLPQATLTGNYRFQSLGALQGYFPVDETDTVVVRLEAARRRSLVTVFGGGARILGSNRWGLRADVRAYVGRNTVDVLVDAAPRVTTGSAPLGVIASGLTPSVQFTNVGNGLDSSLSGSRIDSFETFSSSGSTLHVSATAGYFFRF